MSDFPCSAGCGVRVRIDGLRCALCVRTGAVFDRSPAPPPADPPANATAPIRFYAWRCSCGDDGVELHPLHALFAFYAHRRRCELLARAMALAS